MSATMTINAADLIVPTARMSLDYLMSLTKDVPADRWADCAVENMNSPAFLFGHLAIYPNRILSEFIERPDLVVECPFDEDAVVKGATCLPDASLYATMDVVVPFLEERYVTTIEAVVGVAPRLGRRGLVEHTQPQVGPQHRRRRVGVPVGPQLQLPADLEPHVGLRAPRRHSARR